MRMNQILMWLVTVGVFLCISSLISADLTVEPGKEVTIQPGTDAQVQSFAILTCNIFPVNATVDSRWILPNGEIISQTFKRYRTAQGLTDTGLMSSVLLIQHISFKDEGFYTCEVVPRGLSRNLCTCNDFPLSATTTLQLLVNLFVPNEEIVVKEGNDDFVQLICEMRDYIRPDEDLLWLKGDIKVSSGIGSRYSITFEDGEQNAAQNGGNTTIASRRSVLLIPNPTVGDSGEYTCTVRGTNRRAVISLTVTEAEDKEPTSDILASENVTPQPTTESKELPQGTLAAPSLDDNNNQMIASTSEESHNNACTTTTTLTPSDSCDVEHTQLAAAIICTFVITVVVSVLLTLIGICVCLKLKASAALSQRNKSNISSPTDCSEGNGIVSAMNNIACEEAGIILGPN